MTKPFMLDPRDRDLFRQAVGAVEPLRCDRIEPVRSRPPPIPRFTLADERQVLADMVSDYFEPADLETGEELVYRRDGVQQAVLRKLRRGQFRVGAVDVYKRQRQVGLDVQHRRSVQHIHPAQMQRDAPLTGHDPIQRHHRQADGVGPERRAGGEHAQPCLLYTSRCA